jgi:hypothetical protein
MVNIQIWNKKSQFFLGAFTFLVTTQVIGYIQSDLIKNAYRQEDDRAIIL